MRQKWVILPLLFALILFVPLTTQAITIKGNVVEVQGTKVKIQYSGESAPNVGDTCEIGFDLGGDFAVVEGQWQIVKVDADFAWAQAKGSDAGTPALDYIVKIATSNPKKRSTLMKPKKEKPPKKKKAAPVSKPKTVDDRKPKAEDITGVYILYREGDRGGRVLAKMRIANQRGNQFQVGNTRRTGDAARDWQGRGFINGAEGYYDWEFKDGKRGRTIFLFDRDGNLHGQVRGTRINWDYVAQRKEGPVIIPGAAEKTGAAPYWHRETGLIFWQHIEGLSKSIVNHYQDPGFGDVIGYGAPGITASVYVYNLGMKSIDDNPASPPLKDQFKQAVEGIFSAGKSGHYQDVKLLSTKTISFTPGKTCPQALGASLSYREGNRPRYSMLYVLAYKNHFLKMRFTYAADDRERLEKMLAAFCYRIGTQLDCN